MLSKLSMAPSHERLTVDLGKVDRDLTVELLAGGKAVSSFSEDLKVLTHLADADIAEGGALWIDDG
jgi:hypothetical protein